MEITTEVANNIIESVYELRECFGYSKKKIVKHIQKYYDIELKKSSIEDIARIYELPTDLINLSIKKETL